MGRNVLRSGTARSALMGILFIGFGGGCGTEPGGPRPNDCTDMPTPLIPKVVEAIACDQMVAVDSTLMCASIFDVNGKMLWQGERLLNGSTGDLARYCRYTWVDPANPIDETLVQLPRADDCTFVAPQSWPETFDDWAHNEFIGSVMGDHAPTLGANELRTRVVVLDTSPNLSDISIEPGLTSAHGETLANLIEDLACGDNATNCATEVTTQLVMPWRVNDGVPTYHQEGGNIGRLSDVARGMWLEIEKFRQELKNAANDLSIDPANTTRALAMPSRLVFNESFGFGGDRCVLNPDNTPEDSRVLYKTFQAAACFGIAHVAAAGNHSGGEQPAFNDDLLCPARWDRIVAPTTSDCAFLFGTPEFNEIVANFKKVTLAKYGNEQDLLNPSADALTSVGAVDFSGLPIVMSRANACPEAMALGIGGGTANMVSSTGTLAPMPSYLFGTSVSTAVVSARMAAQWSQDDQQSLHAANVLQTLINGSLQYLSFQTGGACDHLSSTACDKIPWIGAPNPSSMSPEKLQNPELLGAARTDLIERNNNIDDFPMYAYHEYVNDHAPLCTARIPQCVTENATTSAANVSLPTAIVWPQPGDPVCVRCGVVFRRDNQGDNWVELFLDPNFALALESGLGESSLTRTIIKNAALVIGKETGVVEFTIPLTGLSAFVAQSVYKIEVPVTTLNGRRAWISGYDSQGHSFSQQIFVIP